MYVRVCICVCAQPSGCVCGHILHKLSLMAQRVINIHEYGTLSEEISDGGLL